MKKLTFLVIMCFTVNISFSQNNLWFPYNPVQSDVVGKQFLGKRGNYVTISGTLLTPDIRLKDIASGASEKSEFEKNISIGLKFFLGKYTSSITVRAQNIHKTDIITPWDSLQSGRFVFSALKAEKASIEIVKKNSSNITPKELLNGIKDFSAISDASALNVIKLVDSINFATSNTLKVEIDNPSVYYSIQIAEIQEDYNNYGRFYINMLGKGVDSCRLTDDRIATGEKYPVLSDNSKKYLQKITVNLLRKVGVDGKPKLIVSYSNPSTKKMEETEIAMFNSRRWYNSQLLVNEYKANTCVKRVYLKIDAKLEGQNIVISEATLTYPEKIITILTEKQL